MVFQLHWHIHGSAKAPQLSSEGAGLRHVKDSLRRSAADWFTAGSSRVQPRSRKDKIQRGQRRARVQNKGQHWNHQSRLDALLQTNQALPISLEVSQLSKPQVSWPTLFSDLKLRWHQSVACRAHAIVQSSGPYPVSAPGGAPCSSVYHWSMVSHGAMFNQSLGITKPKDPRDLWKHCTCFLVLQSC